jgi:hypothetical protein
MERRYTALRIISLVYRILGGLALILAVLGAILAVAIPGSITVSSPALDTSNSDTLARLLPAVIVLVSGILSGLGLFAVGQMIQLLLDTEENTRRTARVLTEMLRLQQ